MHIIINEIGQHQRQHSIETNHSELIPLLQETSDTGGFNWLNDGRLQPHIKVYINQQCVSNPFNQLIHENDIIDLISPMAGG